MTTEQQRKMLECAAKACWIEQTGFINTLGVQYVAGSEDSPYTEYWNPLTNPADTAEMCAKLDIDTCFCLTIPRVACSAEDAGDEQTIHYTVSHNGTLEGKESAWRLAASMVAAKIGGYTE